MCMHEVVYEVISYSFRSSQAVYGEYFVDWLRADMALEKKLFHSPEVQV